MQRSIVSLVAILTLIGIGTAAAGFSDDFGKPYNYLIEGVGSYAGVLGNFDVLNADVNRPGALYMQTTGSDWAPGPGSMLYVDVTGDFVATVKVVDFAGTLAAIVEHNDSGILARDPAGSAGTENWVAMNCFPTWTAFVARNTVNGARDEVGQTTGTWTGADTFALMAQYPYIQLERKGADFYFRISADGVTFLPLTNPGYLGVYDGTQTPLVINRPDLPATLQVGLMSATYMPANTGYVAYDDFSIVTPAPDAVLVDNFDSYQLGDANSVTTTWKATVDVTIATDPAATANQVIRLQENTGVQKATYCMLSESAAIPEGATKTLFLRFRATNQIDSAFGFANKDTPDVGGNDWGNFGPQVSLNYGNFRVRNSGTWSVVGAYTELTWYNLWIVVDNANDTMQLYLHNRPNEAATEADRVMVGTTDTFGFRNKVAGPLTRFYWRGQNPGGERYVWMDDLYMMEGSSLVNPTPKPAKIIWVSAMHPSTADANVPSDIGFVNLLRAAGYDVDYTAGTTANVSYWEALDPNKLAALDAADLVIIGRDNNSGGLSTDATEIGQWSSVKSPLMLLSSYIAAGNRWQWINTTSQSARESYYSIKAVDANSPLWAGVALDANSVVTYMDATVASGFASFPLIADAGNGVVLATKPDTGNIMVAEWTGGVPFYATSAYTPADTRMLFTAGAQEISGQKTNWGVMNLNDAGQKIFLNAVRRLLEGQK